MEQGEESKGVTRITASKDIQVKPFSRMLADVNVHVKKQTKVVRQGLFVTNPLLTEVEGITKKGDRIAGIEFLECELEVQETLECFTVKGRDQGIRETVTKALHGTLGAFPVHFTQG